MTFFTLRRARRFRRRDLHPTPRRFDAVRVLAPIVTVMLSVALGAALGRLI